MSTNSKDDLRRFRRRRVTLSQLAAQLEVSTATVSLALRDNPAVSAETRKKVQALAAEMGYIYNRQAASLRTARTDIIGVVVHDVLNPYFAEVFRAVEQELENQGFTILICNHRDELARQKNFVQVLQQQNADGLVICPSVGTTAADIDAIVRTGTPVTIICRDVDGASVPSVRGDDVTGMYEITRLLIDKGHKAIAFVGGIRHTSSGRDRHAGFMKAMNETGLTPVADIPELMTQGDGRRAAEQLAALDPRPTAVVCFNDILAFGLMSGFSKFNIRPGIDIAVTGYDDVDGSESWAPSLTTVKNGSEAIGKEAARAILAQIVGDDIPFDYKLIPPQIEVRDSSG
ncbi:LacI family DNA-binding transcriptional regulator [Oryzibacter oryziterrae]|uniref:LacI family DNA-binding transcriptional regulator n=1 Tax=Oryzibacter oryziterrae TaxID=2766474 RepID=UPI001F43E5E5|nr:LacI family DNA-binding transcriptional regulator [Oryzibacter oryziterrae]